MNDVFLEQIVKKRDMLNDKLLKAVVWVGGLTLFAIAFAVQIMYIPPTFSMFTILIVAGIAYYTWYIGSGLNLEFEYIYTNGEIDFDKISAKRKRKRIITLKIMNFTEFEQYDHASFNKTKYKRVINAAEDLLASSTYYAVFKNGDGQDEAIIFSPSEKLLGEIRKYYRKRG